MTRPAFLLSPYRPPTSYPVSLNPDEAAAWLAGYLALWHPAVVRRLGKPPQPASTYDHDQPADGAIYAVPDGPHLYQPDDWPDRVAAAGGVAVRAAADRADATAKLLESLTAAGLGGPLCDAHADVVRAFAGLGYGYLTVETLFDAASHDHLLDADGFWADVSAAAETAETDGGTDAVFAHLRAAAEKLRVAREALNTNPTHLLDLAVPDRDKLDAPWPASLRHGFPLTVLASGELLRRLHDDHPGKFAELKSRFAPGLPPAVDLVCGAFREREDAALGAESQFWNLAAARRTVRELFGDPPAVYGRHRTALHASLPGWLRHAGFEKAVIVNFDGALTPARNAAVVNWPGPDGQAIDALAREPLPASDPLTFFNLAYHLHTATGQDSAPTVAFLHRGDQPAIGYDELLALADLGDVLGAFSGVGRYLSDHHYGEYLGAATPDDFFADYLDDRVTRLRRPDAVSGFAAHYRQRRRLDAAFALAALHRTLTPPTADDDAAVRELEAIEDAVETAGADLPAVPADADSLAAAEALWAKKLADRVLARSAPDRPGLLVLNPCGFARRVGLELDPFPGPIPVEGPVKAAQFDADRTRLVVEVPGLGFAWVPRPDRPGSPVPPPKARLKTAEGTAVRNEFLEADLDPATGAVRAVRDARLRMNRLGLQLVFNPGSKMVARDVRVTHSGAALGEVAATGTLVDDHDAVLAEYSLRLRAWVGRPALEVTIDLDPKHPPTGYPWHAYYGARLAWRDDRAAIFRGAAGANSPSGYTRPGSPDYLELRLGGERSFVFTGGLPFAQRHGGRMADVVLIPEGEKARRFELLVAFDRDYPMQTATGWAAPAPVVLTDRGPPPTGPSGWLGHLDLPSVLLTSLRPEAGSRAVTARVLETAGFGGAAALQFARDPAAACAIDAEGAESHPLSVAGGSIPLDLSANAVQRVRAVWA